MIKGSPAPAFAAALALGLVCAGAPVVAAQAPPPTPQPVWRMNLAHIEADRARIAACLKQAEPETACARVVQRACLAGVTDPLPFQDRVCAWRAIAAWEEELAAAEAALIAAGADPAQVRAAQDAWAASMLADVRLASDVYAGGSLAGLVAAHERAEAVARRALWLGAVAAMHDGD